ncbi:hypothetical protein GALL_152380 [mine drainage metagenome]|uniref:Uncharacterized protein n=1 Tax=mine drainage metagenome TaxID=410659 RepID=A0A1J5SFG3_9ZZZZ
MSGFREVLFGQACEILRSLFRERAVSFEEGRLLRQAWECSKFGNVLLDAVEDVTGTLAREYVEPVLFAKGFLTRREEWHAARLRRREIIGYGGCSLREVEADDLGASWTLDRRVAEFFARRAIGGDGRVVTARIRGGVWLGNSESEVVCLHVDKSDLIATETAGSGSAIDLPWELVKPMAPRRQINFAQAVR